MLSLKSKAIIHHLWRSVIRKCLRQAPGPLEYVRFGNPNAREIEIIPFKDKNMENASASGGKPPDPLNMLDFEIVSCDIPF